MNRIRNGCVSAYNTTKYAFSGIFCHHSRGKKKGKKGGCVLRNRIVLKYTTI